MKAYGIYKRKDSVLSMMTEKQRMTLIKNNEESRNIAREAIQGALFSLIKIKPYNDISITEIIKKSGISRSAFYRNYKTKEDVLFSALDGIFEELILSLKNDLQSNLRTIVSFLKENREVLYILIDARLEHHILDILNNRISYESGYYETYMWNGIIFNIIIGCMKSEQNIDDDKMIEEIMEALTNISDVVLNHKGVLFSFKDEKF